MFPWVSQDGCGPRRDEGVGPGIGLRHLGQILSPHKQPSHTLSRLFTAGTDLSTPVEVSSSLFRVRGHYYSYFELCPVHLQPCVGYSSGQLTCLLQHRLGLGYEYHTILKREKILILLLSMQTYA